MFKVELNYYVGAHKNPVMDFDEGKIKILWARYLAEELRKRGKNRVTIDEAADASCAAFDRFMDMVKKTTIER